MAGLHIGEEENEVLRVEGVLEDQRSLSNLCLVGYSDLKSRGESFLFHFFHRVHIKRVMKGATFNNHLLVFHCSKENEDPLNMALIYTYFLVQILGFLP
ncbi:hypothetical protein Gorai_024177, partial [Gossypium raimondii]|nr:hypothetical protein [Gossypium raimondii]